MKITHILSITLLALFIAHNAYADHKGDEALQYMSKQKWNEAIKCAKQSKDSVILKIVKARQFVATNPKDNSFSDIIQFIQQNPNWSEIKKIKEAAENSIGDRSDCQDVVAWFDKNTPTTDNGAKYYAICATKIVKDSEKLRHIAREGWIHGDFSKEEQQSFLKTNTKYLSRDDYVKKIDYMIWSRANATKISDMLKFVDQKTQRMFKLVMSPDKNTDAIEKIASTKDNTKHPSILLYSYLNSHAKDDVISEQLGTLAAHAPNDKAHASEWWTLKAKYARNLIKQKKYALAYSIVQHHHAASPEDVCNAEFLAGWLALRHLNKPGKALEHFQNICQIAKQPISLARAYYWLGRTEAALDNKEEAHKYYRDAAVYNFTFYGQLAELELGGKTLTLPQKPNVTDAHRAQIAKNELARAAMVLLKSNLDDLAGCYAKAFMLQVKNPSQALIMLDYIRGKKSTYHMTALAKAASYNNILLTNDAFPTTHKIQSKFIDPAFAYAIIRQETVFDQHAISEKNAHGLMQLLPETACKVAKSLKMKCKPKGHLLSDPHYNTTLGTKELKDRFDEFDGSYILTLIAYNAGPHRAREWIETYGDPRKLKNRYAVIDWIETIPFYETRNYVHRVLENLQVYRAILGHKSLKLLNDLGCIK